MHGIEYYITEHTKLQTTIDFYNANKFLHNYFKINLVQNSEVSQKYIKKLYLLKHLLRFNFGVRFKLQ